MDEKVFDFLEKMYIEIQELRSSMVTKQDLVGMATKQDLIGMATKQDLVRMESEVKDDIRALYDGYAQSIEGINEIKVKLDKLIDKVENQEIKLQVLKSAK